MPKTTAFHIHRDDYGDLKVPLPKGGVCPICRKKKPPLQGRGFNRNATPMWLPDIGERVIYNHGPHGNRQIVGTVSGYEPRSLMDNGTPERICRVKADNGEEFSISCIHLDKPA